MFFFNILLNVFLMLGCFVGFFLVNEMEVVMVFVGINIVVSILGILGNLFVCIIVCII